MSRLTLMASWFFTCLGMMALLLVPLVAPESLFADAGSDCKKTCMDDMTCSACCLAACGSDQTCLDSCCEVVCGSTTNDCYNNCVAQSVYCPKKCVNSCPNNSFNFCSFMPMTSCNQSTVSGCDQCGCIKNMATGKCYCF